MRIVQEGAVEANMLLLLLLLLNRLTQISVLQLLVSSPWSRNIAEGKILLNSLATAADVPGSSITSSTVPALAPTGGEGCTFSL
ncbi:hypothetical protein MKW92_019435 [Papaver armeniacum]|nr:hypothetical protein MKW92_019435 [Papaver armeniacum]